MEIRTAKDETTTFVGYFVCVCVGFQFSNIFVNIIELYYLIIIFWIFMQFLVDK